MQGFLDKLHTHKANASSQSSRASTASDDIKSSPLLETARKLLRFAFVDSKWREERRALHSSLDCLEAATSWKAPPDLIRRASAARRTAEDDAELQDDAPHVSLTELLSLTEYDEARVTMAWTLCQQLKMAEARYLAACEVPLLFFLASCSYWCR